MNAPKIQVKSLKTPPKDLISQSATQAKTNPLTGILQIPHPGLELFLYVLEIKEHLFFRKPLSGCLPKRKKKKFVN